MQIVARLLRDGEVVEEVPLRYAGEISTFTRRLRLTTPGPIELEVVAMDPANANFGRVRRTLTVVP
ncbi:MAG: hypothetical protein ACE5HL_11885 [Terriglobia bacterium]